MHGRSLWIPYGLWQITCTGVDIVPDSNITCNATHTKWCSSFLMYYGIQTTTTIPLHRRHYCDVWYIYHVTMAPLAVMVPSPLAVMAHLPSAVMAPSSLAVIATSPQAVMATSPPGLSGPDSGTDNDSDHDVDSDEEKVENALMWIAREQFVRVNHDPVSCRWPIMCSAECRMSCRVYCILKWVRLIRSCRTHWMNS